jgi:putative Mg2+ transporter-C (MgtC) family protein
MSTFTDLLASIEISTPVALLRVGFAFIASAAVGAERELRRQSAGLRTHILIGLGACLLMLLSIWLPAAAGIGDPARIAAQVVSGIGFMGAASVIRFGTDIKGVTTSASIWATAAIGLCLGAGMYVPSAAVLVLSIVTLGLLERAERKVFSEAAKVKALEITFKSVDADHGPAEHILRRHGIVIRSFNADIDLEKERAKIGFVVEIPAKADLRGLIAELRGLPKLSRVTVDERI